MKKNILAKLSPFHFLMLLIAGIINAIGVTLFIAPVQLYDSGISGTSILLSQLTPDYLSLSFFLILLNIPLLLFGFKRQGAVFSIYAIFTVCVYSVAAWLITDVLPHRRQHCLAAGGHGFVFVCAVRRHHLGRRQRPGHPLRRRDGRH